MKIFGNLVAISLSLGVLVIAVALVAGEYFSRDALQSEPMSQQILPPAGPAAIAAAIPAAAPAAPLPPGTTATNPPPAPGASASQAEIAMPRSEQAFVEAVESARRQFTAAVNDMARGSARPMRARALCAILGSRTVENWVGRVKRLSAVSDGRGVLAVEVAPHVALSSWSSAVADNGDKTLIDPAQPVYSTALQLRQGQVIRFNGKFFPSAADCIKEAADSAEASMTDPVFITRFTALADLNQPQVAGSPIAAAQEVPQRALTYPPQEPVMAAPLTISQAAAQTAAAEARNAQAPAAAQNAQIEAAQNAQIEDRQQAALQAQQADAARKEAERRHAQEELRAAQARLEARVPEPLRGVVPPIDWTGFHGSLMTAYSYGDRAQYVKWEMSNGDHGRIAVSSAPDPNGCRFFRVTREGEHEASGDVQVCGDGSAH